MWNWLQSPMGQLTAGFLFLGGLILVMSTILRKIRAEAVQQEHTANELLTKFGELHAQGGLTEAEFRTIKTKLAARLQEELKDTGETG